MSSTRKPIGSWLAIFCGWTTGMLLQLRPTILSGFARVQGDWGDSRLNNYILEHGYRWLTGVTGHERFWSPPVFFPAENTAAYTDLLLGFAPFYWPWRAAGFEPDSSFQLWMLTVATFNYAAAYLLFSRGFRCRPFASAIAAVLFSFSAMRTAQLMHAQLLPLFYIVLALVALFRIFEVPTTPRRAWVVALVAACIAQLYSSFYYAWFLGFALLIAMLWALLIPGARATLVAALRTNLGVLMEAGAAAAMALAPLVLHYLRAKHELGPRDPGAVEAMLPRLRSWIYFGPESSLFGSLASRDFFRSIPMEHEQRLGLGIVTVVCAAIGLWSARRRRAVQFAVLVPATMVVLATEWPGGATAWWAIRAIVPGADALRAISRIGVAMLLPTALGVALCVEVMVRERRPLRALAAALVLVAIACEQLETPVSYDKSEGHARIARIAAQIPAGCPLFFYTTEGGEDDPWRYHVDAMWASMISGVPTVNGYSGNQPPHWPLYDIRIHSARQDSAVSESLGAWARYSGIDVARICRVRTPPG